MVMKHAYSTYNLVVLTQTKVDLLFQRVNAKNLQSRSKACYLTAYCDCLLLTTYCSLLTTVAL